VTSFATELATPSVTDERTYVTYGHLTAFNIIKISKELLHSAVDSHFVDLIRGRGGGGKDLCKCLVGHCTSGRPLNPPLGDDDVTTRSDVIRARRGRR